MLIEPESLNKKSGDVLVKYAEIDKCWMCYHLVDTIDSIKAENPCCMKFANGGKETEVCSNHPVGECEKPLKLMMKAIYEGCKAAQPSETTGEPLTCGTGADYKKLEEPQEEAEKLLEELLDKMPVLDPGADTAAMLSWVEAVL